MRIKSVALTEKGQVKPVARKAIVNHIAANPNLFAHATRVGDKGVFTMEVTDAAGNVIFVNFDVTVSTKAAADRAERKPRAKAEAADSADVTVEQASAQFIQQGDYDLKGSVSGSRQ